jgi:uncharacterized repeat protein (TIGR03943 family)
MTARTRAAICLIMSVLLFRLAITGQHRKFVRPGLGPFLLLSAVVLALATFVSYRANRAAHHDTDTHDHDTHDHDTHDHDNHDHDNHDVHEHSTPRVGSALFAVAAVLFVVAPGSLSSFGLRNGNAAAARTAASSYAPLERNAETPMAIKDFVGRAFEADAVTLQGATVRMTGFIDDSTSTELRLARYQIACCAADAQAAIVRLEGTERPPGKAVWVTITGTFAGIRDTVPTVEVASIAVVEEPTEPYE